MMLVSSSEANPLLTLNNVPIPYFLLSDHLKKPIFTEACKRTVCTLGALLDSLCGTSKDFISDPNVNNDIPDQSNTFNDP